MPQTITLYVDGACRGNGQDIAVGGWGAYILTDSQSHQIYGGELNTTNNRMELTAAIEGIALCPTDHPLIIWTDSTYVKRGITEWITGWKKKNWKDVKNPDLWKKLDALCQDRNIEWNWIKGHAGHEGNEMADHLANLGVDLTLEQGQTARHVPALNLEPTEKKPSTQDSTSDWLFNDPFGFDAQEDDEALEEEQIEAEHVSTAPLAAEPTVTEDHQAIIPTAIQSDSATPMHPAIVITAKTLDQHGPRQLILDTETTGFYYQDGDRIIEIGALEMINRKLTGSSIHIYINPEKLVGESERVHGISDEFLKDKPKYAEIAQVLYDYLKGAEIIAHNASFDMNFLDMEFNRVGLGALSDVCTVTDSLALAKAKHPGQKNSLDALVRRYEIPERDRTFHGALLDAEILADVYLAMTGGQVTLDIDVDHQHEDNNSLNAQQSIDIDLAVILPSDEELAEHENWVKQFKEKHGTACLFDK